MANVVSLINMKGGVGKTTLTVNIGYSLTVHHSKKTLIVEDESKRTILDIFNPRRKGPLSTVRGKSETAKKGSPSLDSCTFRVHRTNGAYLDLIPSELGLMEIIASERRTEDRLNNFLKEKANHYDYILIDCPPTISIFTQASILASQGYLVPLKPDPLSTIGLPLLERWLDEFTELAGMSINPLGIVFCMVRSPITNSMNKVMRDLRKNRPAEVFKHSLTQLTSVAESVESHQPLFQYRPGAKCATEIIEITNEFLSRMEGS